jgi:hypothetical protein
VEKKATQLVARIYPVASASELDFTFPDGVSHANLRVNVADWKKASVTNSKGRSQSSWERYALEFVITPGETYEVR